MVCSVICGLLKVCGLLKIFGIFRIFGLLGSICSIGKYLDSTLLSQYLYSQYEGVTDSLLHNISPTGLESFDREQVSQIHKLQGGGGC